MNKSIAVILSRSKLALSALVISSVMMSPALSSESGKQPATIGEISAKHQDAILAQKFFSFNSEISFYAGGARANVFTASGTVNLDGWSHYSTVTSGDASVKHEYYVKDDLPFRFTAIEKEGYGQSADTSEGWELVSSETFHRDVSINPLYIFAQLLDKSEPVSVSKEKTEENGCREYKADWSENGSNVESVICVAESGLATVFTTAQTATGGDVQFTLKMTAVPLAEAVTIVPPEKARTLFDDEKKKEEEKQKKKK